MLLTVLNPATYGYLFLTLPTALSNLPDRVGVASHPRRLHLHAEGPAAPEPERRAALPVVHVDAPRARHRPPAVLHHPRSAGSACATTIPTWLHSDDGVGKSKSENSITTNSQSSRGRAPTRPSAPRGAVGRYRHPETGMRTSTASTCLARA